MTPAAITLAPDATPRDIRFRIELRRPVCLCGSRTATSRASRFHCDRCGSVVEPPPHAFEPSQQARTRR